MKKATREKIRASLMGHPVSKATRLKMSLAGKGKKHGPLSDTAKGKISKANLGRKRTKAARAKMRAAAFKRIGSNGKPRTPAQLKLYSLLGKTWTLELPIKIGNGLDGYPTNYKVDIGNRSKMIAIECDGVTHRATKQKVQDIKKDQKLKTIGWKIIRLSDEFVLSTSKAELNRIIRNG